MSKLYILALMIFSLLTLPGAACISAALPAIAQGAQLLGSVIDVADAGQRAYFGKHADMDAQAKAQKSVDVARKALAALNAAHSAAASADDGDLTQAKDAAVASYKAMRELLKELGVLDAAPREGGAEGIGPDPEPVDLPTPEAIERSFEPRS